MELVPDADSTDVPFEAEVPFVDLRRTHTEVAEELQATFSRVVGRSGFILGEEVAGFESEFADYCQASECVGVASGTAALTLGLVAAGIGPGDEVIVPAHTFIASALSVVHAGATPVYCDVDDATGLIDVASAEKAIGPRTAAIMAVHLYGQVCDMHAVEALARRHGLAIVEDAAQAHGARFDSRRAGSFGHFAAFSFYPSKNLGALGDGGAICTGDAALASRVRRLRDLGQRTKGDHVELGSNERLDGLQAAFLRLKLKHLDAKNADRRSWARLYGSILDPLVRTLHEDPRGECVYHLYPVRVPARDRVLAQLEQRGVQAGIHYSPPLHLQPPLAGHPVSPTGLAVAKAWADQELSLPMFGELTEHEVRYVCAALEGALGNLTRDDVHAATA